MYLCTIKLNEYEEERIFCIGNDAAGILWQQTADGIGYHQIEGQPVEVLRPGDVVMCPPDVKHWHGASANSRFAHLAAGTNPDKPAVVWTDEMLSKEEYDNLPKE